MPTSDNDGAGDLYRLNDKQSPQTFLESKANQSQFKLCDEEFAVYMDSQDPLGSIRQEFFYPKMATLPNG
jgi:hypothetical protein